MDKGVVRLSVVDILPPNMVKSLEVGMAIPELQLVFGLALAKIIASVSTPVSFLTFSIPDQIP